jgi:hypothetical protein
VYFDGTAHGLTTAARDIDAASVLGSKLYFSSVGNANPPGVGGTADDADICSWDGSAYAREWDATAHGLPGNADIDGLHMVAPDHFFLSFAATSTSVPTLGVVQDEDVIEYNAGTWSVYFNGTAHGLTGALRDVDAIYVQ